MVLDELCKIWEGYDQPFLINAGKNIYFDQLEKIIIDDLDQVNSGDVVAIIGDFDHESIFTFLRLIDKGCILVPLTIETKQDHDYFFKEAKVQYIYEKNKLKRVIQREVFNHDLLKLLRASGNPGLILFTTGTTGRPKAILHDLEKFLERYKTPRKPMKTLSFLLFDHIGGINTLLHMLFNRGTVITIKNRNIEEVISLCGKHQIELLPTTPTFLRLLLLCDDIHQIIPKSLKVISYGTERLDEYTLKNLCERLPSISFRQTYGMSELGILRIKSFARNSLFMKVGGEGVETKIVNNVLHIKSKNKMLGYLNAESPFDGDGWYCTKDIVESNQDNYLRITGRDSDVINVGGLKFMPSEIERVALSLPSIKYAKAYAIDNPITGQHAELLIDSEDNINININNIKKALKSELPPYMIPLKIVTGKLKISHRFKKL